jgi:hypothetical protein
MNTADVHDKVQCWAVFVVSLRCPTVVSLRRAASVAVWWALTEGFEYEKDFGMVLAAVMVTTTALAVSAVAGAGLGPLKPLRIRRG